MHMEEKLLASPPMASKLFEIRTRKKIDVLVLLLHVPCKQDQTHPVLAYLPRQSYWSQLECSRNYIVRIRLFRFRHRDRIMGEPQLRNEKNEINLA